MVANTSCSPHEHKCMLRFHFTIKTEPILVTFNHCVRQRHQEIKDIHTVIEKVCIKHSLSLNTKSQDRIRLSYLQHNHTIASNQYSLDTETIHLPLALLIWPHTCFIVPQWKVALTSKFSNKQTKIVILACWGDSVRHTLVWMEKRTEMGLWWNVWEKYQFASLAFTSSCLDTVKLEIDHNNNQFTFTLRLN